ncbi:MAG: DUF4919 domain-containing protein [Salinivirgaceae bacterium]|nr:MAG: DUF4919 domain-containing protein [Salinivirgaceae bacterium]
MRFTLIILTFFFVGQIQAQEFKFEAPNYKKIKKATSKKSSEFYYPNLLDRFESYDTSLNNDDYRHLYYGYLFQDGFEAYWSSPVDKQLNTYYRSQSINEEDYDTIISLINVSLADFPFDLRNMNFKAFLYHKKGDDAMANNIMRQYNAIIDAMLSSGDGKTCESGIHVISVSHEYLLLSIFELQMTQQSLIGDCDYMELAPGNHTVKGIYFNVSKILEAQSSLFK